MNPISQRKKYINKLLKNIDNHSATGAFKQEMMTFAYVLVCGTIEYMIENILQDWLDKTAMHHNHSRYRGRKYVQYFLDTQYQLRKETITHFHSTDLGEVKKLIIGIAGKTARDDFNALLENSNRCMALQPDINARLQRINMTRHHLAHGSKTPIEIQPNITELIDDFNFVYTHIIENLRKALPKV